eukprot:44458_1
MASANPPELCIESKFVETIKTLNLSQILNNIGTFSKGKTIHTKTFYIEDLTFDIDCYPKGTLKDIPIEPQEATDGVAVFINILRRRGKGWKNVNDNRKVCVCMTHDGQRWQFMDTVDELIDGGMGFSDMITLDELKDNPNIEINIKIFGDPLFVSKEDMDMPTFLQQNEKMHELNQLHGDVMLIVKTPDNESDSDALYVPPQKKRKLNGSNKNKKSLDNNDVDCGVKMSSIVLRAASKVFDRMLDSNMIMIEKQQIECCHIMIEKQQKTIEIQAKCIEDVNHLVYFMSTNRLHEQSNVLNLIELAHYYEMERLYWKCVYALIKNVTVQTFVRTLKVFEKYGIEDGYNSLVKFAKTNMEELKQSDGFETVSVAFKMLAKNK